MMKRLLVKKGLLTTITQ